MDLLTGNMLRRVAAPLRTYSPSTFEALRSVRNRLIGGRSEIPAHRRIAVNRFQEHCSGARRILEVGAALDLSTLSMLAANNPQAAEVVGINKDEDFWAAQPDSSIVGDRYRLMEGDAARLPFDDASFDAVFSVATFEHLTELPTALEEIQRVLRPGGKAYAHYGPIWSSGKGHHVNAAVDGEVASHADPTSNPIPDFAHLLLDREEFVTAIRGRVSDALAEAIVYRVYDTKSINRLFNHEYDEMFRSSGMRIAHAKSHRDHVRGPIRDVLEFRYGTEPDFGVTNGEILLVR